MLAVGVDRRHEVGQRNITIRRDLLQSVPEGIFKADTRLVRGDDDGSFDNLRLHWPSPVSSLCWARLRVDLTSTAFASMRDCFAVPCLARCCAANFASCNRLF